jgi:hypothetical protein
MRWVTVPSAAQRIAVRELAERAVHARPDVPALHIALADVLEGAGEADEALSRLQAACDRFHDAEPTHSAFASALTRAGRIDAALAQVSRWTAAAWARKLEFKLLMRAGHFDRLEELEAALAEADPADPDLLEYRALKWRDRPEALLLACDEARARDPDALHPLYHKALALIQLGRGDEAAEIMALEQ